METLLQWRSWRARYNFDTSYKGWKLCYRELYGWTGKHFDTSYKGWKPKSNIGNVFDFIYFDTSYKGWKPIYVRYNEISSFAISILPIRDGNLFCTSNIRTTSPISILPIRDGNRTYHKHKTLTSWISILPIRDGNSRRLCALVTGPVFRYFL